MSTNCLMSNESSCLERPGVWELQCLYAPRRASLCEGLPAPVQEFPQAWLGKEVFDVASGPLAERV
jgi:hypothetical protein